MFLLDREFALPARGVIAEPVGMVSLIISLAALSAALKSRNGIMASKPTST